MAITSTVSNQVGGGLLIILNNQFYLQGSTVEIYYQYGLNTRILIKSIECPSGTQQVIIKLPLSDLSSSYGESGYIVVNVKIPGSETIINPDQGNSMSYDYSDFLQRTSWRSFKFDS